MSYQTSSKRSLPFWLLIGARNLLCFSAQKEGRTTATVLNWSGKTLSPGALLVVLYFSSFHIYFSARLDFPSPPLSAPGSPRMCEVMRCTQIGSILLCGIRNPMKPLWQKKTSDVFVFTFLEPIYRYFMWLALYLLLLGLNFAVDSHKHLPFWF